jgi:hypothetical protein
VAVAGWQFWGSLESAFKGGHFGAKMTPWRCVFIELWGVLYLHGNMGVMVRSQHCGRAFDGFVVGEWQWLGGSFEGRWKARLKAVILVLKWRCGDVYLLSCEGFFVCMATWGW